MLLIILGSISPTSIFSLTTPSITISGLARDPSVFLILTSGAEGGGGGGGTDLTGGGGRSPSLVAEGGGGGGGTPILLRFTVSPIIVIVISALKSGLITFVLNPT